MSRWVTGGIRGIALLPALAVIAVGCEPDLDTTREATARGSFGEIVYQEACQRVAYTAQLDEMRDKVDVNNSIFGGPVCLDDQPAPEGAPEKLKAIQKQKPVLVRVVDLVLPDNFLSPMEKFLEAIGFNQLLQDGALALLGKADLLVRPFDTFLNP